MAEELDAIARYGLASGFEVRPRTVLVEGTTDADLFRFAARLERQVSGVDLFGASLTIVTAGDGDLGGTHGVIKKLLALREMSRICLLPNGRPAYRFIGVFDNDQAGRDAIGKIRALDRSILEYRDVFRLRPSMPVSSNLDPSSLKIAFENENAEFKGLDWELEDLLPDDFWCTFQSECRTGVARTVPVGGKVHRDLTADGKARFHRFIKAHALHSDLVSVVSAIRALRAYLGLK